MKKQEDKESSHARDPPARAADRILVINQLNPYTREIALIIYAHMRIVVLFEDMFADREQLSAA